MNTILLKTKFYVRTHMKVLSKTYDKLRNLKRNFRYIRKCGFRKLKAPDTFFFVIDPSFKHPGLADRLKAIIAAYNQAKQNHLDFKIIFKTPFALEDYLNPAMVSNNWKADFSDLEYSLQGTRFVNEENGWQLHAKAGKQYHCYNYKGDLLPLVFADSGFSWHELFAELFVPSKEIQQAIKNVGLEARTYDAVHLRFVNALENFEEGYYNGLPSEKEKQNLILRCKKGIRKIINQQGGTKQIVVFSDSERFLNSLSDLPVITLDSSSLGHISFTNAHPQIVKTFLDFFVMSRANKVYRIASREMYLSSCFSLCAARAGNVEFENLIV